MRAVKFIATGKGRHLRRFGVSGFLIRMLALYPDVCLDGGGILPWRPGNLYDQPARELAALRSIRSAWAKQRDDELKSQRRKSARKR